MIVRQNRSRATSARSLLAAADILLTTLGVGALMG